MTIEEANKYARNFYETWAGREKTLDLLDEDVPLAVADMLIEEKKTVTDPELLKVIDREIRDLIEYDRVMLEDWRDDEDTEE